MPHAARRLRAAAAGFGVTLSTLTLLHGRFAARAALAPGAVAVSHAATALTYGELAARASRLARWLRGLGVGPEARVGVLLDRTPDLPAALFGPLWGPDYDV